MAMDLRAFMAKAEVDDGDVAVAVKCDRTTISRIRRRCVAPSAVIRLRLDLWADSFRRKKRWPPKFQLSWNHLLPAAERRRRPMRRAG